MKDDARRPARAHRQLCPRRPDRAGAGRIRASSAALPLLRGGGPRAPRDRGPDGDGQGGPAAGAAWSSGYWPRPTGPGSCRPSTAAGLRRDHRRTRVSRLFADELGARPARTAIAAALAATARRGCARGWPSPSPPPAWPSPWAWASPRSATQHQLESAQASNAAITRVVAGPRRPHRDHARRARAAAVTVVFSGQQRAAVVTTTGMTSLPSGRVYQLWVMSPSGARSAGLLSQPGQTIRCWPPACGRATGSGSPSSPRAGPRGPPPLPWSPCR